MKKYKVTGTTMVTVYKEVWANSEDEAYEKAHDELPSLEEYCGNGGWNKLVGVEGEDETVEVFDEINYDEIIEIKDDPDYFQCSECGERCERATDRNGVEYWYCNDCYYACDDDGNEFCPTEEEDEE